MEIMNREKFFAVINRLPPGDLLEIQRAYWLAKNAHRVQERDGGERYFEHPRAVAFSLMERGFHSKTLLIKALLHDVIEDTFTPSDAVVSMFGHDMWMSLLRLSKYIPVYDPVTGKLIGRYKKEEKVYYEELSNGPEEDQLTKVADRRHNLGSMTSGNWTPPRQKKYAIETKVYILPMALRVDSQFADEISHIIEPLLVA